MKNLTVFLLLVILASVSAAPADYHPTPQQVDSLVRATMAINPWPEKGLPPFVTVEVPTPTGTSSWFVGEWGNTDSLPGCYWQVCQAELEYQAHKPPLLTSEPIPFEPALASGRHILPFWLRQLWDPSAKPAEPPTWVWPLWNFVRFFIYFFAPFVLTWGFRKNLIPSAGARILPDGLKKEDSPGEKGNIIARALKLAGVKQEEGPRFMDFVATCGNGLVSRSLKGFTYTVHGMHPVQVRIFGAAALELYKIGIKVIRVEMGHAIGVATVSDPNGGRGSLLPDTLIFRVYYEPGCIEEGEVENADVTSLSETVMQAIPLPCPPPPIVMPDWPLTAADPHGNDVY